MAWKPREQSGRRRSAAVNEFRLLPSRPMRWPGTAKLVCKPAWMGIYRNPSANSIYWKRLTRLCLLPRLTSRSRCRRVYITATEPGLPALSHQPDLDFAIQSSLYFSLQSCLRPDGKETRDEAVVLTGRAGGRAAGANDRGYVAGGPDASQPE